MRKILSAGIGNIFNCDDAFGCEVVSQIDAGVLPQGVTVRDFGIRSHDLAYALADGYDSVILVDAAARGQPPGTVYLIEPDLSRLAEMKTSSANGHDMNPVASLQLAQTLGGIKAALYLVACEPSILESEAGEMGLSRPVRAAVPRAVEMIHSLVIKILESHEAVRGVLSHQMHTPTGLLGLAKK